jgi:dCMP deaminase
MKPKFVIAHMKAAGVYAELSSAKRLHVGCVIVKDNTIIGIGYNGMPSGWDNNCENMIQHSDDTVELKTKPEVLHAETNAIAKVARSTNSTDGADMFITHAPCLDCAKLIHQAGIKRVYFGNHYRDNIGVEFLQQCGVVITHVDQNTI